MKCRLTTIWAGCMVWTCLFGCVSKAQFEAVNHDYQIAQTALEESTQTGDQCQRDKMALQQQVETNHNEIRMLSQRIDTQNQTIRKKESVIALQSTFIRLFDDSKQTLQTSIDEQRATDWMTYHSLKTSLTRKISTKRLKVTLHLNGSM